MNGKDLQRKRLELGYSRSGLSEKTLVPVRTLETWEQKNRRVPAWFEALVNRMRPSTKKPKGPFTYQNTKALNKIGLDKSIIEIDKE